MTNPNTPPTPSDWADLVHGLVEMRDALVATALALRDHQLTLDSPERRAAGVQVRQIIERAQSRPCRSEDDSNTG